MRNIQTPGRYRYPINPICLNLVLFRNPRFSPFSSRDWVVIIRGPIIEWTFPSVRPELVVRQAHHDRRLSDRPEPVEGQAQHERQGESFRRQYNYETTNNTNALITQAPLPSARLCRNSVHGSIPRFAELITNGIEATWNQALRRSP